MYYGILSYAYLIILFKKDIEDPVFHIVLESPEASIAN